MKIAILGDIHSNLVNLKKALEKVKNEDISHLLVTGDLQEPEVIDIIGDTSIKASIVLGNSDYDTDSFRKRAKRFKNVEILNNGDSIMLEGKKIGLHHYHLDAIEMAKSGKYDLVFSGHRHSPQEEKFGETVYIRPGEIAGHYFEPTFCIFDLKTMKAELILINR